MNRGKKLILLILIAIGLSLLTPLIVYNSEAAALSFPKMEVTYSLFIGPYLNAYLFWGSLSFFILLVVAFFVVVFLPKRERSVTVKDDNGALKIEKKSIESYVSQNLDRAQFVERPRIKVRMTKHKIGIKVLGQLSATDGVIPTGEQAMAAIQSDLQQLLGVTDKRVGIEISFVDYAGKKSKKTRVQ